MQGGNNMKKTDVLTKMVKEVRVDLYVLGALEDIVMSNLESTCTITV